MEFLYDYSDTYGREVKFIPRESFSPPPPSALDAGVLPHAVQTINSMGIYYAVSGNYGSRLGGTAQLLPQPVEFAFGKKETVSSRYAIIVNDWLSDSEKVRAIFHEIGHILCSHLYYEAKDKRIVKLPERNRDSLSHYMKEYEAESVCREFCGFLGYQYDPSEYLEQYDEGKEVPGKENQVFIMNALNILIGYWDKAEK